jgi:hypothetical protein
MIDMATFNWAKQFDIPFSNSTEQVDCRKVTFAPNNNGELCGIAAWRIWLTIWGQRASVLTDAQENVGAMCDFGKGVQHVFAIKHS